MISYCCNSWNNAGCGSLVSVSSSLHTVISYPYSNGYNDITQYNRGSNAYLMQTSRTVSSTINGKLTNTEVDIDINIYYSWFTDTTLTKPIPSSQVDLHSCMLHELGHLLGLSDIIGNTNTDSAMHQGLAYGENRRYLAQDDKDGLAAIYK